MAGFSDLLGSMIQNNIPQAGQDRLGNILQDLQASFGQAQAAGPSGSIGNPAGSIGNLGGGLGNGAGDLLGSLLASAQAALSEAARNPAQAGGLGAMLGSVLGGGGDSVKGALGGGALAMLAGVAFKALTTASNDSPGASPFPDSGNRAMLPLGLRAPVSPAEQQAMNDTARLVIQGMIGIAKADGEVSADEIQRILGRLQTTGGLDAETQQWLTGELARPLDLDALVAEIPNQGVAAQVYAGSLLATAIDTEAERNYLRQFAHKAGLAPQVVGQIHHSLGVAAF